MNDIRKREKCRYPIPSRNDRSNNMKGFNKLIAAGRIGAERQESMKSYSDPRFPPVMGNSVMWVSP